MHDSRALAKQLVRHEQCFIDGGWVCAEGGTTFDVTDPATGEVVGKVCDAGPDDVALAIKSASRALNDWRGLAASSRASILLRLKDAVLEAEDSLAQQITLEQGKPVTESLDEVRYAAGFLAWAAGEAVRVYGELIPASNPSKRIMVLKQPVGVTAAITPWNFPLAMLTRKCGPALAAGCVQIVKPAEQTPLTALAFAQLAHDSGVPPGVLQVLPTSRPDELVTCLFESEVVRKVSFTGSTEVGQILIRRAAGQVTRLALELGGHAPVLVFDDADLELAVEGIMAAKFRNGGQTCLCVNRIYVQRGIYDALVSKLKEAMTRLVPASGFSPGCNLGPMIDDAAVAKIKEHVADACSKGAKLVWQGDSSVYENLGRRFCPPVLIREATEEMLVMNDESFGPIVAVRSFDDEPEGVMLANRTRYGLAAYFFTKDSSRLMRVAEALEFGIVGANDGTVSAVQAPFGGYKMSGLGREGGKYAMDEYLETKFVSMQL